MQYTNLGRTGLQVSRLCLGTMNFGPQTTEEDSFAIMDKALELGINFFDTANVYGWKKGEGLTEQNRWTLVRTRRRTARESRHRHQSLWRYGRLAQPEPAFQPAISSRACDESLRRLQTDFIDLYQMHHIAREAPWEEIWQAMETLVRQGKVLYVGSSNFAGWHIAKAQGKAKRRNFMGLVSEQSLYNLNARMVELEVIPSCEDFGLGVIPWSPLAGGLLGGVLQKIEEGRRASEQMQEAIEENRPKIEAYEGLLQRTR